MKNIVYHLMLLTYYSLLEKFLNTDMAWGRIFEGGWSGLIDKYSMDVDTGYKYIEKRREVIQW